MVLQKSSAFCRAETMSLAMISPTSPPLPSSPQSQRTYFLVSQRRGSAKVTVLNAQTEPHR